MVSGRYTLGIDIGDATVLTAVGPHGDDGRLPPAGLRCEAQPAQPAVGRALRRVGTAAPMIVDGEPVDPAGAVAACARRAADRCAPADRTAPAWTVLTVPPSWGEHRRDLLSGALQEAGLARFSLDSSAVAVLRHHRGADRVPVGAPVVVVDVGASTVDTAVVRAAADSTIETIGVPPSPLAWGGRDLDDAVVALVTDCLASEDRSGVTPSELKRACVAAKAALSADTVARVDVTGPDGTIALRLVREDLEELLDEPLQDLVGAVRRTVADAGLELADVSALVLSGGTAAVPLIAETLSAQLARPVVVGDEPAHTAALGAAELASDHLDLTPVDEGAADLAGADRPGADRPGADSPGAAERATLRSGRRPAGRRRTASRAAEAAVATGAARPDSTRRDGRPPARAGGRPPVPDDDRAGRRVAARVGVVLSAFVALVLAVAVAVSAGWTGGAGRPAAAGTVEPTLAAPAQDLDGTAAAAGLSPAAAVDRAGGGRDDAPAPGRRDGSDDEPGTSAGRSAAPTTAGASTPGDRASTGAISPTASGAPVASASGEDGPSVPGTSGARTQGGDVPPADPTPSAPAPADPTPSGPPPADPAPDASV